MAVDNDNNLPIRVDGNEQAIIGTDVYVYGGQTAHAQVMKVAWGNEFTVNRATLEQPLPVQVYGITGSLATVTVTGSVRGLGTFNIGNTSGSAIHVTGGVNSFVYGVAGATPVAVTGSVSISSLVGITGTVNTTGGRFLSSSTDSIMVSGTLAKSWNLTNANDNITVYGFGGATFLSSKIAGSDGTIIGNSGGALNVNVVGAGISANISISPTINVQNATGGILLVQGTANGTPIPVNVNGTPNVSLRSDAKLNEPEYPLFVDSQPTTLTINNLATQLGAENNFAKMLIAQNPRQGVQSDRLHSTAQWLSYIWDAVGEKNSFEAGTIQDKLNKILDGQAAVKSRIDVANDAAGAEIKAWNLTGYTSPTNPIGVMTSARTGYMYINSSENDILLTTDKVMFDLMGQLYSLCQLGFGCPDGVSSNAGTLTFTSDYYNTNLKNRGYLLHKNTSAFLPIKFNRYILIPDTNNTTGILTVIIS